MKKSWETIRNYFPIFGFVIVVVFFSIATKGAILSGTSLQSLLNQAIATALVSIGSVFVFGCGCFDMSMGGTLCMTAVLGGYAGIASGSIFVMALACLATALVLSLLKGLFAAYVEVPLFIVTIVLGFVLSALVLVIMGTETTILLNDAVKPIPSFNFTQMSAINIVALAGFFIVCVILFNFTALGRKVKILGGNPVTARQTGLNSVNIKLISFIISGVGVALAALVALLRIRSVGSTYGADMGTDVMIALVLGGMPLTGGPRTRISAGIIGALTITVLNSGLSMLGLDLAIIQIFRAVIYLAVVYVASMTYRTNLLPR